MNVGLANTVAKDSELRRTVYKSSTGSAAVMGIHILRNINPKHAPRIQEGRLLGVHALVKGEA